MSNLAYKYFQKEPKESLDLSKAERVNIILLDDDPTFGEVIKRYAKKYNISLEVKQTVSSFAEALSNTKYDVVILDYYLDEYTGTAVAQAIHDLPIVLISRKSQWQKQTTELPTEIRRFIHKKYGADKILSEAISLAISNKQK